MKEIVYIGYYDCEKNSHENRNYVLSAVNKMTYICSAINKLGYKIKLISASGTRNPESYGAKCIELNSMTKLQLLKTNAYSKTNRLKRIINRWKLNVRFFLYLMFHVKKGQKVIVYHSLGYAMTIRFLKKIKDFYLILEVEEIYSDVTGKRRTRKSEEKLFKEADAYIFPTELLERKINIKKKPSVIIYGTYQVETEMKDTINRECNKDKINCVYAGTFDPRKGGAAAAAAAEFLPANYHIHILGFGTEEDIISMKKHIDNISCKSKAKVSYDGLLKGKEYIQFIQNCDIGLSTQNPEAAFNDTSFPSKILSYLANGLRVVSIRIPAIEMSAIGKKLYYYEKQTPEEIAKAILSVDMQSEYDSKKMVTKLANEFERNLRKLLESA